MNKTKIEWVKNPDGTQGYTWNPITGCLNHINGMCKGGNFPCYAYRLAHGRLSMCYTENIFGIANYENLDREGKHVAINDPFYPRFWPLKLLEPGYSRKPKGIFVCDMSDLFGIGVPNRWTERVMAAIKTCPQHRFYLLTKQPQNLPKFSPFPENCWVGVTATNPYMMREAFYHLKRIEARVKYISFEPLLDDCHVGRNDFWTYDIGQDRYPIIHWLIIGAQTKPYKLPKIEWVQEIVEAADKAGVPVFLKNNLWPLLIEFPSIPPIWAMNWNGISKSFKRD